MLQLIHRSPSARVLWILLWKFPSGGLLNSGVIIAALDIFHNHYLVFLGDARVALPLLVVLTLHHHLPSARHHHVSHECQSPSGTGAGARGSP